MTKAHKEQAREDLRNCYHEFSQIEEKAAAVLPTELWIEIKELSDLMVNLIIEYDENKHVEEQQLQTLVGRMAKVAIISRVVIGVDELTGESLSLSSNTKHYEWVANMEVSQLDEVHDREG